MKRHYNYGITVKEGKKENDDLQADNDTMLCLDGT